MTNEKGSTQEIDQEKKTNTKMNPFQTPDTSEWETNGLEICLANNEQKGQKICNDGSGGAIITWADNRDGTDWDIYAQRVDAAGFVKWGANGLPICTAINDQNQPDICSDGSGGAIITWADNRDGTDWDIYAQKVNSSGAVKWTDNGKVICNESYDQLECKICSDENGGAVINWEDERSGSNKDLYAQRINGTGDSQWIANGVVICNASGDQLDAQISIDGSGGAIITWEDERVFGTYIYAQRINSTGGVNWTTDGTVICNVYYNLFDPQICSDGTGGAFITWEDFRGGGNPQYYAQRVNSTGYRMWHPDGVIISDIVTTIRGDLQICNDGTGSAIIVWSHARTGTNGDVYAQKVNSNGIIQWTTNGVPICTVWSLERNPTICPDGAGGAIITWEDHRNGWAQNPNYDIYAQKINTSGDVQWTTNGIQICVSTYHQLNPLIISDGVGGAIITWEDERDDAGDIYAQHITKVGDIDTRLELITPESRTYTGPMSGHYPATFGFENDEDGTFPTNWYPNKTAGSCKVVSSINNHKKVVELYDSSASDQIDMSYNFTSIQTSGTVEMYLYSTDISKRFNINIYQYAPAAVVDGVYLRVDGGNLEYRNPVGTHIYIASLSSNTWYHFSIEFNSIDDKFWISVNGVKYGGSIGYDYRAPNTGMKKLQLRSGIGDSTYYNYIDAVGFSWDPNYKISDNLREGLLIDIKNSTALDWIAYSLDGQMNKTINGDKTIPMPINGPHTIQVFANDTLGYMYERNRAFSVNIDYGNGDDDDDDDDDDNGVSPWWLILIPISLIGAALVTVGIILKKRGTIGKATRKKKAAKGAIKPGFRKCPNCSSEIQMGEAYCPYCGTSTKASQEPTVKKETPYISPPFEAYEGNEPYAFVGYSHEDKELVFSELIRLHDDGFKIWYDEGIFPSSVWEKEIPKRIKDSSCVLVFISPQSVKSDHISREISYAIKTHPKQIVPVYLEETKLPIELDFNLTKIQGIMKYELKESQYTKKIDKVLQKFLKIEPDR